MEILIKFLAGPVLGALIGFITNTIAIKMLFRPLRPVFIGSWRLPFTPGIIPREQPRIAKALGALVRDWLLTDEVMTKALISRANLDKLDRLSERFLAFLQADEKTLRQELNQRLGEDNISKTETWLKDKSAIWLVQKIAGQDLKRILILPLLQQALADYKKNGGFKALLLNMVDDQMLDNVADSLTASAGRYIAQDLKPVLVNFIGVELKNQLDTPVCDLSRRYEEQLQKARVELKKLYCGFVGKQLPAVLKTIDISSIVETRILSLNPAELEKLIFSVVKKELNAIVWLGGLIGFVLGLLVMLLP